MIVKSERTLQKYARASAEFQIIRHIIRRMSEDVGSMTSKEEFTGIGNGEKWFDKTRNHLEARMKRDFRPKSAFEPKPSWYEELFSPRRLFFKRDLEIYTDMLINRLTEQLLREYGQEYE